MKKYLLISLLAGCIALVGCSTTPAPAPQTPVAKNTATTSASGKDVYDKNCAGCHGPAGAGATAPALNTEARTPTEVMNITQKGKGTMPGYAKVLSDSDIQAVANYIAGLKK